MDAIPGALPLTRPHGAAGARAPAAAQAFSVAIGLFGIAWVGILASLAWIAWQLYAC